MNVTETQARNWLQAHFVERAMQNIPKDTRGPTHPPIRMKFDAPSIGVVTVLFRWVPRRRNDMIHPGQGQWVLQQPLHIENADQESIIEAYMKLSGQGVNASATARKLAEEYGLDLTEITGTGVAGKIVKGDVVAALENNKDGEDEGS